MRQGQEHTIAIPADMMQRCMREGKGFADPNRFPMVIKELPSADAPAAKAGLQPGDSIVGINGMATPTFYEVSEALAAHKGEEISLDFYRSGMPQQLTLKTDTAGKIGVMVKLPTEL